MKSFSLVAIIGSMFLTGCFSEEIEYIGYVPVCEFKFVEKGNDCQDWTLNSDGTCSAMCHTLYNDTAGCPLEDLSRNSPIQPASDYLYVNEDGSLSYAFRGKSIRTDFPEDNTSCRHIAENK